MTIKYAVFKLSDKDLPNKQPIRVGTAMSVENAMLQGSSPGTYVEIIDIDPVVEVVQETPQGPVVVPKLTLRVGNVQTAANTTTFMANGTSGMTIAPIPAGAICEVFLPANKGLAQPDDFIINDGSLFVTTTVVGIYSLKISFQNYLDFSVTFNAT